MKNSNFYHFIFPTTEQLTIPSSRNTHTHKTPNNRNTERRDRTLKFIYEHFGSFWALVKHGNGMHKEFLNNNHKKNSPFTREMAKKIMENDK